MTYRIQFVRSAAKAYSRLDPVLQRRVDRELHRLGETPRHAGVIRLQSADELYRVRIGDLRLLFSVEDQILLVLIVKIGHRVSVYRGCPSESLFCAPINATVGHLDGHQDATSDGGRSQGPALQSS